MENAPIKPAVAFVPDKGYRWVEGQMGIASHHGLDLYLVPLGGPMRGKKIEPGIWAEFLNLKHEPEALLAVANKWGRLGIANRHFHSTECGFVEGESFSDWSSAISRFQRCYEIWELALGGPESTLKRYFARHPDLGVQYLTTAKMSLGSGRSLSLRSLAKLGVALRINSAVSPGREESLVRDCYVPDCRYYSQGLSHRISNHLRCGITWTTAKSSKIDDVRLEMRYVADSLETTLWLGLAEFVCGGLPPLKRCEAPDCGGYINPTEIIRRGSKRMHKRCGERLRKRTYRMNLEARQP